MRLLKLIIITMGLIILPLGSAYAQFNKCGGPIVVLDVKNDLQHKDKLKHNQCHPPAQEDALGELNSLVSSSLELIQCGNYAKGMAQLEEAINLVNDLALLNTKKSGVQSEIGR
jgi:hypothetical protein